MEQNLEIIPEREYEQIDPEDIPDLVPIPTATGHHPSQVPNVQYLPNDITVVQHRQALRSLNEQQQNLFYFIRDWILKKKNNLHTDSFHIYLEGGAGTGKSHLIKCIYHEVKSILPVYSDNPESPVVLLLAPTGTAAFGINGQTIHSAFSINKATSNVLSEDKANTLRAKYQDLHLLIIDEISMVSPSLLNTVHCRLQQMKQLKSSNAYFGNVSILVVGDFFQVPSTMQKPLCLDSNKVVDLWPLFYIHVWHLDEVVRQKNDIQFMNMLNRLRKRHKKEEISQEDLLHLNERLISFDIQDYPFDAIHIFSTNKQLNVYNQMMLNKLISNETKVIINAVDTCMDRKTQNTFRRNEPLSTKDSSPQASLTVAEQARVMLTTNIDVNDGLTNEAMGVVTSIIKGTEPLGQTAMIFVLFDNRRIGSHSRKANPPPPHINKESTLLKVHTEVIQSKPYQITRYQYPIQVAWAVTIHKTQGMTADKAVVSLDKIF